MAESNLSTILSEVIRKAICKTVEQKLKSKTYKIILTSASKGGENNFCGIIYRVLFNNENETNNGENSKFSLIAKLAPSNVARRIHFHSREIFLQEIYMYNEILPSLRLFEQSKGVNIEVNGFVEYPICYQTSDKEFNECLLLEDVCVRGFRDIDRYHEEISADHVYLIMKTLGKFHAISLALKDQQPDKFNKLASNIQDVFIRTDITLFVKYQKTIVKNMLDILNDPEDAQLHAKVENLFERDAKEILIDCFDLEQIGFASVISYGDAWQNNTMFRYDDKETPIEVSFLDWQVPCYSSPIIDIVYFMFCCTKKALRDAHYDHFLKVYYESLSAHMQRLGSDPEKLFPFTLMQEHLHKLGKFGLISAAVILPLLVIEKGNGLNLDGIADNADNIEICGADTQIFDALISNSKNKFNKRLRDVVIDMIQLGYI